MKGLFITLEGGEGVGKSTAAARLAAMLREDGAQVVLTREPGGTPGAEAIRSLLLGAAPLTPWAQTLLHFAARADHIETLIRPALAHGAIVICDRYYDSTLAYQAYGQGVAVEAVQALIRLTGLHPDITFLLDVPGDIARTRLAARAGASDRYEDMGADFFTRVTAGFRAIAQAEPERVVPIDATAAPDALAAQLRGVLRGVLRARGR